MSDVAVVTVWWFGSSCGAQDALERLHGGDTALWDGAVVSWPVDRALPEVSRPGRVVGDAALAGALVGVLVGLPLLAPLVGVLVGAFVGLLAAVLTRPALPADVLLACRGRVRPGSSALVLLSAEEVPEPGAVRP
ncbi:DUF1269 domain-containing protein [Actinosynnema sp. NPDC020468]|uniref:DUF1269 domain-containing protein n=1 Tax=Actinosynnema sp. NPDC020468 TaxID=3154488 RepID=UPI0033E63086